MTAVAQKTGVLAINDLHASIEGKEILRGVNLTVSQGEVHALMGLAPTAQARARWPTP